ncbi:PQQ-binding-like beta-propeller repeat protein [Sphingomonas quercus]|uniref:PQQ-binding-like beta-propeller repeat protein n=1 Tax=Sphingomonas quercus TaxID=2842451 RepID=A0ABS6BNY2_9SPHN|nr:PQQ-binding-like beta-propeller repeat protein [Sphingomonas quercus]MBU3078969.1 PQQ-binding-like beta-propeller repeat protein [Sphingomonas quercus]
MKFLGFDGGLRGKALATSAVIALSTLATGLMVNAQPAANDLSANPFANDSTAPAQGRAIFDSTCSACHGTGAGGSERAPALNSGIFQHGGSDNDIFQTIRSGVPNTMMPSFSALPTDDVWKLVTYIKSLSGQAGPRGVATGNVASGEQIFFGAGGCTSCHEVNGRGTDFASDLSAVGTKPVAAIRAGVLHQPAAGGRRGPPAARPVDIVTKDGKTIHGVLRGEDSFYVLIQDASGKWTTYERSKLKTVANAGSATPTDIATRFSPSQIDDLVAYLASNRERNLAETAKANPRPVISYAQIAKPDPKDWPTYWGNYSAHHFSDLAQITPANVKNLQLRWSGNIASPNGSSESSPIVVDGVMYFTTPGEVVAYDVASGIQKWAFHRKQDFRNPAQNNANNKGVAVLDGRVFVGTLDCLLIAIDANTGRQLWETRTDDTMEGFQLGGAPLVLDGKIIMGMSGGEFGTRGYLDAYDPATGKRLWRTYTIPGPGEPGHETWGGGDAWKYGGAPTWLTGSYDPETHTLYWAVGNPGPDYNAETRPGDNLYTDSVLAIDPETGKIKWHYQFTPNDDHDWDATEALVLTELNIGGTMRKVILHADRNGVYYVLDRTNGQFITATPFVRTNWFTGFDKNGRPDVVPSTKATYTGNVVFPATGGTNFQAPSYDRRKGVFYLQYVDSQGFAISAPVPPKEKGKLYLARGTGAPPPGPEPRMGVKALDAKTGRTLWNYPMARVSLSAGVLGTAGNVLFVAAAEGQLIALDQKSGKPLWHAKLPGTVSMSPISYAVNGKQHVAIIAANTVYNFALPDK